MLASKFVLAGVALAKEEKVMHTCICYGIDWLCKGVSVHE